MDAGDNIGIGNPAVSDVRRAVAPQSDFNWYAFEAARGSAWDAAMFEDKVAQSAFCVGGSLAALLFVGDVYEEFDDASVLSFRDGVGEGMDDDVPIAEEGFVVDGVIEVTGEAGVIPKQDAMRTVFNAAGGIYEVVEFVACGCGAARFGDICKFVAEGEIVFLAIGFDLGDLLVCGGVLARSARVADVGVYDGVGRKCGGGREVQRMKGEG